MKLAPSHLALSRFLDPMFVLLVALAAALYLAFRGARSDRRSRRARIAVWALWASMWVLSTPAASAVLVYWTEMRGPPLAQALAGHDLGKTALVVLAAGTRTYDPEVPPRERLDGPSTQRVLAAARLWKEHPTGLVLLSGSPPAVPAAMEALLTSLGVPASVVAREDRSRNTRENAKLSAEILRARGVETVVVVTSATHLRRAVADFARAGIHAIPAPAELTGMNPLGFDTLLPSASSIGRTHVALHELLGRLQP
jgi:uncharacterized SAM-binding protein YcdF (DUF218 family)